MKEKQNKENTVNTNNNVKLAPLLWGRAYQNSTLFQAAQTLPEHLENPSNSGLDILLLQSSILFIAFVSFTGTNLRYERPEIDASS